MIKNQIYIKKLTPDQRRQLEAIAEETGLKSGTQILLHALGMYLQHKQDIARLNRIIQYKQSKIERMSASPNE